MTRTLRFLWRLAPHGVALVLGACALTGLDVKYISPDTGNEYGVAYTPGDGLRGEILVHPAK